MSTTTSHELIARGACVLDGHILLCRQRGQRRTFLPGGHMEHGERAPATLRREIFEELGCQALVGCFLGVVEHAFTVQGECVCEVNLIFAVEIEGVRRGVVPVASEVHLEFVWHPVGRLDEVEFEPAVLRSCLSDWVARPELAAARFVMS